MQKKVLMLGPARSVRGGISAVVDACYEAGLNRRVELEYLGTMEEGSRLHKLFVAVRAYLSFLSMVKKYDIVHINMASDISLYRKAFFVRAAFRRGKRVILHQHGGNFDIFYRGCSLRKRKWIDGTLQMADRLLVITPHLLPVFEAIVGKEKLVFLPNGVAPAPEGDKDYTAARLLFLGRLCPEKGIGELLQALESLREEYPRLVLCLGGVWEDSSLKRKAESMGSLIQQPGWVGGEEKERCLRECNLFLLPSYFEGHPVSLLEAMARGLACIATDIGGIREVIQNGENGILVPAQDAAALAAAIRLLLDDPALQKKLGTAARQTVEKRYDIGQNIEILSGIYDSL